MHHQRIALILFILLAVAVNAATNIVPAPHLPQCQTKNDAFGRCYFAAAVPKGAQRRCK
jgi:hypothetical protein